MGRSLRDHLSSRLNSELNEVAMLVLFLLLALVMIVFSYDLPSIIRQVPLLVAGTTVLLIAIRLVQLFKADDGDSGRDAERDEADEGRPYEFDSDLLDEITEEADQTEYDFRTVAHVSAIIGLFVFLIYGFGYLIASFIFIIVMGQYFGNIRLSRSILLALGVTGFIYFVFIWLLSIPLPEGLLF